MKLTNDKLVLMYNDIGLVLKETTKNQYKGHRCNVRQWPTFRTWVNEQGEVTIKTCGAQKSFKIKEQKELEDILYEFEIL